MAKTLSQLLDELAASGKTLSASDRLEIISGIIHTLRQQFPDGIVGFNNPYDDEEHTITADEILLDDSSGHYQVSLADKLPFAENFKEENKEEDEAGPQLKRIGSSHTHTLAQKFYYQLLSSSRKFDAGQLRHSHDPLLNALHEVSSLNESNDRTTIEKAQLLLLQRAKNEANPTQIALDRKSDVLLIDEKWERKNKAQHRWPVPNGQDAHYHLGKIKKMLARKLPAANLGTIEEKPTAVKGMQHVSVDDSQLTEQAKQSILKSLQLAEQELNRNPLQRFLNWISNFFSKSTTFTACREAVSQTKNIADLNQVLSAQIRNATQSSLKNTLTDAQTNLRSNYPNRVQKVPAIESVVPVGTNRILKRLGVSPVPIVRQSEKAKKAYEKQLKATAKKSEKRAAQTKKVAEPFPAPTSGVEIDREIGTITLLRATP